MLNVNLGEIVIEIDGTLLESAGRIRMQDATTTRTKVTTNIRSIITRDARSLYQQTSDMSTITITRRIWYICGEL